MYLTLICPQIHSCDEIKYPHGLRSSSLLGDLIRTLTWWQYWNGNIVVWFPLYAHHLYSNFGVTNSVLFPEKFMCLYEVLHCYSTMGWFCSQTWHLFNVLWILLPWLNEPRVYYLKIYSRVGRTPNNEMFVPFSFSCLDKKIYRRISEFECNSYNLLSAMYFPVPCMF